MKKYRTFAEFENQNKEKFDIVLRSSAILKSPKKLSEDSMVLTTIEDLEYFFLSASNYCTDLLFGLSASVLDAQAEISKMEGLLFSQKEGNATEKRQAVACDPQLLDIIQRFNELSDLKKYLEGRKEDFLANHYFYRNMRQK